MDRDKTVIFMYFFIYSVNKYVLVSTLSQGRDFVDMTANETDKAVCSRGI